jgi:hypothetical protein
VHAPLTPPGPYLKGAWYPGGFNPYTYQVKTWFQNLPFEFNLHRYSAGATGEARDGGGQRQGGALQVELC